LSTPPKPPTTVQGTPRETANAQAIEPLRSGALRLEISRKDVAVGPAMNMENSIE